MPTTDTKLNPLIINKLTKAEYTAAVKEADQFYLTTDTHEAFLGSLQIGWAPVVSTVGSPSTPVYLNSNVLTACSTSSIAGQGMPDYTAGFTVNSGYVATQNCIGYCCSTWDSTSANVKIDGVDVFLYRSGQYGKYASSQFLVPAGSTITFSGGFSQAPTLYPCIGG